MVTTGRSTYAARSKASRATANESRTTLFQQRIANETHEPNENR